MSTQKNRYVFREMLSVGIDGHGVVKTHLECLAETRYECRSFAFVAGMADDSDRKIESAQEAQCVVRRAIDHHDDITQLLVYTRDHIDDGTGIVEGRYQRTDGVAGICTIGLGHC